MDLNHILHVIKMMSYRVMHADAKTMYGSYAMLAVSLMFLIVGCMRWVEFLDFGFSKTRRTILIIMHLVGCVVLAMAFSLEAMDIDKRFNNVGMGLLASALVLLFPIHIYLGLLRRLRLKKTMAS